MHKPVHDKFFVSNPLPDAEFTAGVARKDAEAILLSSGWKALSFHVSTKNNFFTKIARIWKAIGMSYRCPKASIVLFQLPVMTKAEWFLLNRLKTKGVELVGLIHDIDGLRDGNEILLEQELERMKAFTCLVAHNSVMRFWLEEKLPYNRILSLDLFDYPCPAFEPVVRQQSPAICIAANFAKAGFVYRLPERGTDLAVHLYGPNLNTAAFSSANNHIHFEGVHPPQQLPALLKGSFGLVWDGDDIETCAGNTGNYLRYNSPHKASLYLAAGLPLIVWEESAIAGYVVDKGIGILISSLTELYQKIEALSETDYQLMLGRIRPVRTKIIEGGYLRDILQAAEIVCMH
jgi:hypothetical protein